MIDSKIKFSFASDRAILLKVGNEISPESNEQIAAIFSMLSDKVISGIQSFHPAYNSLLITFDPVQKSPFDILDELKSILNKTEYEKKREHRVIKIPVCYKDEFAPDLLSVAQLKNMTIEDVIKYHTQPEYLVYFLGFSPGFPYLGGMVEKISAPRLETPRLKVPKGSVAIGGNQTGIYPVASPGGWRLIGRTPLKLFSYDASPPTLLQMGDFVKFFSITQKEFFEIQSKQ